LPETFLLFFSLELQIKQSPALESNVLKKVATLTLDNALADSRSFGDVKPKPPPDKLQFHTCAKFEGKNCYYTAWLRSPSETLVTFERLGILKFCFLLDLGKGPW
jgi:hypothetical protein